MRAALLLPPERTFATSQYKAVYDSTAMPKHAYQVYAAENTRPWPLRLSRPPV